MNILITGGTGYLGGRLVQWLTENTSHSIFIGSRKKEAVSFSQGTPVIQTNWSSQEQLEVACNNMDVVIHLAAMDAIQSAKDPTGAFEVNSQYTTRLLNAAVKKNVSRFIYLSTAHVYGQQSGVIRESSITAGTHPYATSHKAGEDAVLAANAIGDIKGIVLRLSNSFGAPAHKDVNCWTLLIPDLCKQAVEKNKLVLTSDGHQKRNFISIKDACRAINFFIDLSNENISSSIFNIGSKENRSVLEMAQVVQSRYFALTGLQLPLERAASNTENESVTYRYDIELLINLGFLFTEHIESTVDELLIFCQKNYGKRA